ncbi:unnamed protein product [Triticum turgidum subsp. durum]|uniref:non-specific serine/threonine protein kinase n=1 Tax=Triticum turgidum subsp. durum TaxID=4567 RepID=A0A9R0QDJ9_TRITD|nr:unnamed protein product [Triticum turgidum subsp. durum]
MGRSSLEELSARPWLTLLLGLAAAAGMLQVRGQRAPSVEGFISIDCGLDEKTSYVDVIQIPYTSDAGFTDAGSNHNTSAKYWTTRMSQTHRNVRSFPDTVRSCYTLPSLVPGSKYLVRATFRYGDYDGLDSLPVFDVYLGVNFWQTVNVTEVDMAEIAEVIAVIPDDSVQVCLVNVGSGTPFISALVLRPLENSLYPPANATQGLVLIDRYSFGDTGKVPISYPDDPYDRNWLPFSYPEEWSDISTAEKVKDNIGNLSLHAPSVVMQTAITSRKDSDSKTIELAWDIEPNHVYPVPGCIAILYAAELEILTSDDVREYDLIINGKRTKVPYRPKYLIAAALYNNEPHHGFSQYSFTVIATANSTLPPMINAFEFFSVISTANVGTDSQDVSAINKIKVKYQVKKNWMGDPCAPKNFSWNGLTCSYPTSGRPRITSINMSNGGLSGDISSFFADIKDLQCLDLSYNNLTGSIPNALSQLPSLVVLDLTGNQLNGSIPAALLKRTQDGSLAVRHGNNPNLCSDNGSCQTKKKNYMLAVYIGVPIFVVLVIGALVVLLMFRVRKKKGLARGSHGHGRQQMENRQFTYKQLKVITDNFKVVLGQGGFGTVYDGFLHDGTHVAVKLLSQSSNQGIEEFMTEAQTLTKIHHKNLVSLIGYCKEEKYLALVYEHMSEGNLEDKLRGKNCTDVSLTWRQRLHIALESAQGLEYLHKACSPPFVHRDVKTSNILLNANLEAKVADFGLMKAFNHDNDTHISTVRVIGTRGYLAPEYATALQLNEKSDVYSFGIVLLEVITGHPAIQQSEEVVHIVQWARLRLTGGNIEEVVDTRMQADYNINGVWKAMDLALKCAEHAPGQRPTMTDVVAQLQHCLELEREDHTNDNDANSGFYMKDDNGDRGLLM